MMLSRTIDRRLIFILLATLAVALSFWLGSRLPNLNEKAMMAGDAGIEALGFDQVFAVSEDEGFLIKVGKTTINWMDTNKRGMTFGVLFAACLTTLLSLFERRSFRSSYGNAFLGTLIGAPLGVCVNCAAPIAQGLHTAGTRLETTLATMISSPTLNVIVLTMLFALMPWYLIVTKLSLTLLFILLVIPLMCRLLFKPEELQALSATPDTEKEVCDLPLARAIGAGYQNSWWEALTWFARTLPKNLWRIVKMTVPLMALAGLLGSLLIVAVPWDELSRLVDVRGGGFYTLLAMVGIAVFGTFLPVPITFDVVIVVVLLAAGLPEKYAAVLLFTLGIFSIYSFQIVWTYVSRRAAVLTYVSICCLGVAAGVAAHYLGIWDEQQQRQVLYQQFRGNPPTQPPDLDVELGLPLADLNLPRSPGRELVTQAGSVAVSASPLQAPTPMEKRFAVIEGIDIGINDVAPYSLLKQLPPRYWGRAVATGDIHGDGWPDVVLTGDSIAVRGLAIYANVEGKRFQKQSTLVAGLEDLEATNVNLVDLNNDGWLDIFFSTYRAGNYFLLNEQGDFTGQSLQRLPDNGEIISASASFGDLDHDGDLDIAVGNWALGYLYGALPGSPVSARDYLLRQSKAGFSIDLLDPYPGATQSVLFTDFDGDRKLDLIVGNDYGRADLFYRANNKATLEVISAKAGLIPHAGWTTMSVHSADIDNDLQPEVYVAQITPGEGASFARSVVRSTEICADLPILAWPGDCEQLLDLNERVDRSHRKLDVRVCVDITDRRMREDCLGMHVLWAARAKKDSSYCEYVPPHRGDILAICEDMFGPHVELTDDAARDALPEHRNLNVLLSFDGERFVDRAEEAGLAVSGWSWNSKFADLDNDGFQDIYIANGHFPTQRRESNFLFHNQQNGTFLERTSEFGLTERRATGSYSYVDYDRDCDLDLIVVPITGMVRLFENNLATGSCVQIELADHIGNRLGIGSQVRIRYGDRNAQAQMREIQSGGGFLSADELVAHFGLGEITTVEEIEILWSTGESTQLEGPFPAGHRYLVRRTPGQPTNAMVQ